MLSLLCAWSACCLAGAAAPPGPAPGGPEGPAPDTPRISTLQRLVRHFDFEEARLAPYEMPIHFFRYGAEEGGAAQGFPPFGRMRLSDRAAHSGDWSFEFELDGGSLAARVPTGVVPAVPYGDYLITAMVRTEGLTHARAGIAAWLHGRDGEMIRASRVSSDLVRTRGEWAPLSIVVRGEFEHAADLAIELHVLQPRNFRRAVPAAGEPDDTPLLEDVTGRAWFDDVKVWHLPRIELDTGAPGNVIVVGRDAEPSVTALVRDVAHEALTAHLHVLDIDGNIVFDQHFPAPRMPRARTVALSLDRYGWYEAVLDVNSGAALIARRRLSLVIVPESLRPEAGATSGFGIALDRNWASIDRLEGIIAATGCGAAIVPVRTGGGFAPAGEPGDHLIRRLEQLIRERLLLTFSLESVPEHLARSLDIGQDEVLVAVAHDTRLWADELGDVPDHFGLEVERWQLGAARNPHAFWQPNLERIIDRARDGLTEFVPAPLINIPLAAEHEIPGGLRRAGRTALLPYEVQPESIDAYADLWREDDGEPILVFETAPRGLYGESEVVTDLLLRGLYAWRAGLSSVMITAPWRSVDETSREDSSRDTSVEDPGTRSTTSAGHRVMPEPTFAAWARLADHLGGRRFGGELRLGRGLHAWVLHGEAGDSALVAWSDRTDEPEQRTSRLQLADGPITVYDAFGNAREVPLVDGEHVLVLDETPVFIENIDAALARFRGAFALAPAYIPAESRVHEHEMVLHNPWDVPISGTLFLSDADQIRMVPRVQQFMIRPDSQVRLPVQIVLDRAIPAGTRRLEAQVALSGEAGYRMRLATEIEIGLPHVELSATWTIVRNVEDGSRDLVVTQYVTNVGNEALYADVFLTAPEVRQMRRLIAGLEPGEMAVRRFVVPDGVALLSGRSVRISLTERGGIARLNHVLEIPALE